jgi:hypothetical protein
MPRRRGVRVRRPPPARVPVSRRGPPRRAGHADATHRRLQKTVGEIGGDHRDGEGDEPDPAQRRHVERPAESASRMSGTRDSDDREQRDESETALVHRRTGGGHHHRLRDESDDRERPEERCGPPPSVRCRRAEAGPVEPHDGESGSERKAEAVGVCAVVDPGSGSGAAAGSHGHGGCNGDRQHGPETRPARGRRPEHEQQRRPHEVELLLHGERPQVAQQLGRRRIQVARPVGDGEPVVAEGHRPEHLAAQPDENVATHDGRRGPAHDEHEGEGRQQASCASHPEPRDVD